jgi:hypothetical protein
MMEDTMAAAAVVIMMMIMMMVMMMVIQATSYVDSRSVIFRLPSPFSACVFLDSSERIWNFVW